MLWTFQVDRTKIVEFRQWWNRFFHLLPQRQTAKIVCEFQCTIFPYFFLFLKNGEFLHTVIDLSFLSLYLMTRKYLKIADSLIFIYLYKIFICPWICLLLFGICLLPRGTGERPYSSTEVRRFLVAEKRFYEIVQ